MATRTKTWTENYSGSYKATWTFTFTGTNVTTSGATITVNVPEVTAKYVYSGKTCATANIYGVYLKLGDQYSSDITYSKVLSDTGQWPSGVTKTLDKTLSTVTFNTSDIFNASNKTSKEVNLEFARTGQYSFYLEAQSYKNGDTLEWENGFYITDPVIGGLATIYLNVPPTFTETFSYTGDYGGVPYANLTTANITLSSLAAYYGGDFSGVGSAEFTIGSQTVTKSNPANNDVLSIALNSVGTFTPTVKVTDSRGQVTTHTLADITVKGYDAPAVSFTADRTASSGVPDDEGTYATLDATFTFTEVIASLIAPSVVMTDENGTQTTPTVTWYSTRAADGTLSGSVTWSSLSDGDTVYGLVPGLNTQYSYSISVRPRDSEGTGTAISQTVPSAFYTVDFLAGGHGIAFGQPASQPGFECNMATTFHDTVTIEDDADFGADILVELPNYQTSDPDKSIADAVSNLGWTGVITNAILSLKNWIDKVTNAIYEQNQVNTIDLSSLTTATNVSIRTSNASKVGQVVCLNLVIDVTASKSEGATLISNVPNEILPTNQTNGAHNGMPVRLETSGSVVLSAATTSKTWNRITFTYITNN